jgi:hypothetical protein
LAAMFCVNNRFYPENFAAMTALYRQPLWT